MAQHTLIRTPYGLGPANQPAADWLNGVKSGTIVAAEVKKPRNGKFHNKFWAMLDVAYANHEWPEIDHPKFGKIRTSYDMFRKYVTVRAGHYTADLTPGGEIRAEPKSISFAKMDQTEFEALYSDVLDVILGEFLTNWKSGDMDRAINEMMSFA